MSIPADHISIDGDTAWWVSLAPGADQPPNSVPVNAMDLDRPCDTGCNYGCDMYGDHGPLPCEYGCCPDCHGTGRHVFDIEVACPLCTAGDIGHADTLRVHVVPGMVLPIYPIFGAGEVSHDRTLPHTMMDDTGAWYLDGDRGIRGITFPSAAAPGMYAIQLKILS